MEPQDFIFQAKTRMPELAEAKNKRRFRDKLFWALLREAERIVIRDTRCLVKEQKITAVVDQRAVNMPDDFFFPIELKVKEPSDDDLFEGDPIRIKNIKELDSWLELPEY